MQANSFKLAPLPLLIWAIWAQPAAAEGRAVLMPVDIANQAQPSQRPGQILLPVDATAAAAATQSADRWAARPPVQSAALPLPEKREEGAGMPAEAGAPAMP